jgi:hypothetical protein
MYMRFENSQGNADVGWETVGESSWLPVAGTFADCNRQTSIPAIECEALMALYFSSTGYKWEVYPGWLTQPDPCEWRGVTCENGSVTRLIVLERENWGTIPPEIGNLTNLVELRLASRLLGVIPPEIGNLTQLRGLYLNGNNLYGAIPPELGNLTELEWLVLDGNRLAGSIPIQLGQLTHLERLSLTDNDLSGSIPPQLGNLTELRGLQLRMNQLSGEVPTTLQDLPYLRLLNLRDQKGCLTAEPDFAAWLSTFDVDWNNGCF